jgi:4-hydroxy-2-oxoheptanedioate aldolase
MQHGVIDYQTAVTMLQSISTTPTIPLARVPWNDPAHLMKILDAGVYGVICPMISTREQAEALVQACKYPPAASGAGDRCGRRFMLARIMETMPMPKSW